MTSFINLYPEQLETYIPGFSTDESTFIFSIYALDKNKNPITESTEETDDGVELLELGNFVHINMNNITEIVTHHLEENNYKYEMFIYLNNIAKYKITLEYEFNDEDVDENKMFKYKNILKDISEVIYLYYQSGNYEYLNHLKRVISKYNLEEDY